MRFDLKIIQNWIDKNSRILDLGCGDGTLLEHLRDDKGAQGYGLEIDADEISACIAKGLNVIEQDLDRGLGNFADNSFDTVLMTQALQTMTYPHKVLDEMLRVGKDCIVTFPNFGHWKARLHLLIHGRMPVSDLLPWEWYDTPNIHFCTCKDFEDLCSENGIIIVQRQVISERSFKILTKLLPNLFGDTAIYRLTRSIL